jgi:hypothetical protein
VRIVNPRCINCIFAVEDNCGKNDICDSVLTCHFKPPQLMMESVDDEYVVCTCWPEVDMFDYCSYWVYNSE